MHGDLFSHEVQILGASSVGSQVTKSVTETFEMQQVKFKSCVVKWLLIRHRVFFA